MYFLGIGLVLLLLKVADFGPVGHWPWWVVGAPFALAALWWVWADWSGYTKRRAMDRMEARKAERLRRQQEALQPRPNRRR